MSTYKTYTSPEFLPAWFLVVLVAVAAFYLDSPDWSVTTIFALVIFAVASWFVWSACWTWFDRNHLEDVPIFFEEKVK